MNSRDILKIGAGVVLALIVIIVLAGSAFTTDNGTVSIVTSFGEAKRMAQPGLGMKMPIRDSIVPIDTRTRLVVGEYKASAKPADGNESIGLTADVQVLVNWTVVPVSALDLYKKHGPLEDFERIILKTKLGASVKSALAGYTPKELMTNRTAAEASVKTTLEQALFGYSKLMVVDSIQLEQIGFPKAYTDAIAAEQIASKSADAAIQETRRQSNLDQKLVNAATAQREADKEKADGAAYGVTTAAAAKAAEIKLIGDAEIEILRAKAALMTPILVEFNKSEKWDGVSPTHIVGSDSSLLLSVD